MLRILCVLAGIMLIGAQTYAATRDVEVTATGATSQDAITAGLVEALGQVSGVAIQSIEAAKSELSSQVSDGQQTGLLSQQQQSATLKLTGGIVSSYRVVATTAGPPVTVQLVVSIAVFEPKGLGNDTRRSIAVATFATNAPRGSTTAELLRDRITAHLVQARRFAVVDRAHDEAYSQETDLLRSGDASLNERVRLGQVIGADYIVTGKLRQIAATRSDRVISLTGEVVTSVSAGSAEADYQVIEIATRQIKWAGTVHLSGDDGADSIAARIAEEITQTIYPMRLIRFADPANLIINQGGDSVHVGQRLRAMVMGEALTDPYTHESLGQVEQEAGVVEVTHVDAKVSYAQLVSGHLPPPAGDTVQVVLRPVPPAPRPVTAARRAAPRDAPAVTKLPFDP